MASSSNTDQSTSRIPLLPTAVIILKSSDGKSFTLEAKTAAQSEKLRALLLIAGDNTTSTGEIEEMKTVEFSELIQDSRMTAEVLEKVIEYCKKHSVETLTPDEEKQLEKWDQEFIKGLTDVTLQPVFYVMLAADYLEIKGLLELSSQCAADSIKDHSVEAIRMMFGILNDFTPEEEEELKRGNWGFE